MEGYYMAKIKVCIDPGHGGKERWNVGPTGYVEADGALDISKRLRSELLSTGAFEVKLTREVDATLALTERGRIAASWGADLFISQHSNAGSVMATGSEVFYSVDIPGDKTIAAEMAANMASTLGITNRGAKTKAGTNDPNEDYYSVIDSAQDGGVKHVFISEAAFHSNPKEEALLKDPNKRQAIAVAQAKAICKFYGVSYKGSTGTAPATDNSTLALQKALNTIGIKGANGRALVEDGDYGPNTEAAVRTFQAKYGLTVDGDAGPKTWAKIEEILKPAINYETELCRVIVNGENKLALTGKTKSIEYARATFEGAIKIQCVKDGVIVSQFNNVIPKPTPAPELPKPTPVPEAPKPSTPKTSILGPANVTAEQMAHYVLRKNLSPKTSCSTLELARLYLEEGAIEGVRGDIAFAQAIKETGFFAFGGDVVPEQNNFAGIGTTGGGVKGQYFNSPRIGVRAQIQHLKAYASKEALKQECIDPRYKYVTKGIAPNWEDLNGRWAVPGNNYGQEILEIHQKIRQEIVMTPPVQPAPIEIPKVPEIVVEQPKPIEIPKPTEPIPVSKPEKETEEAPVIVKPEPPKEIHEPELTEQENQKKVNFFKALWEGIKEMFSFLIK
jgi:N-acetylmuramoyl-L-alanine amidase